MRVMIDTNIIISAALFPNGRVAMAFYKALTPPYQPVICDYVLDELHRKFSEKFPDKVTELESFLYNALSYIQVVPTPEEALSAEAKIRDPKDRPILRAALNAHAEFFLTGDKDFLESSVKDPRIINVSDFMSL
ncbi:MAG: putative toxin-antitoxin system toxin component, PIN family [Oscillospiraceae bacterium]|nr:putative toxin-antitoxin system toxin component, PIN family [Oscillospiraceae bacterium]